METGVKEMDTGEKRTEAISRSSSVSTGCRRILLHLAVIVGIALLAEVFLFNVNHWKSLGYHPVSLMDAPVTIDSSDEALYFGDLDVDAHNITVRLADEQGDVPVHAEYQLTDAGMSEAYSVPKVEMLALDTLSQTQNIHPYGDLKSLRITFPEGSDFNEDSGVLLDANSYPIYIQSVTLDTVTPFSFSWLRFVSLLFLLLFVYCFRPKSPVYRMGVFDKGGAAGHLRRAAVIVPCVLAFVVVLAFPAWVQVATATYNADHWDGAAAVELTEPEWYHDFAYDEYSELARSFTQGRLDLVEQPPSWLAEVANPWDLGTQQSMSEQTGDWYKVDAAYHDGHYYVYFGVVPVLILYLPFHVLTGGDLPGAFAVLIATVLYIIGLYLLLRSLVRYRFRKTSLGVFLLVYLGTLMCSVLLIGLGRPTLYQVPIGFARAFAIWGLFCWYEGYRREKLGLLAGGSLCIALIAGCRPQLLFFALLLVPLVIWAVRHLGGKRGPGLAALLVPFVVVGVGLMWYNAARFGSPLDFGASYNLAGNDMSLRGNVPERLVDGLFFFLLQPANLTTGFPFLQVANTAPTYLGMTIIEPCCGGLFATLPFLWAIFRMGPLRRRDGRLYALVWALLAAGVIVCCFDVQASGICGRYYQDFAVFFALGAALVVLARGGMVAGDRGEAGSEVPVPDVAIVSGDGVRSAIPAAFDEGIEAGDGSPHPGITTERMERNMLIVSVMVCLVFMFLQFLFMESNASCNTGGGSNPVLWEYLRQTFQFWT